jgi:hypothetical protein
MFPIMIPEAFASLLAGYATCFQARSYPTFQWLVLGWVQCLGRRTLTAVALASGAIGQRHVSVFHRFFARAVWSLDAVGQVVFGKACGGCRRSTPCTWWATTPWPGRAASA